MITTRYGNPRRIGTQVMPPHPMPADRHALAPRMPHDLTAAVERILQKQLVDPAHQRACFPAIALGAAVHRRTADLQRLALCARTELRLGTGDYRFPLRPAQSLSARDEKSFCTPRSPIMACRLRTSSRNRRPCRSPCRSPSPRSRPASPAPASSPRRPGSDEPYGAPRSLKSCGRPASPQAQHAA